MINFSHRICLVVELCIWVIYGDLDYDSFHCRLWGLGLSIEIGLSFKFVVFGCSCSVVLGVIIGFLDHILESEIHSMGITNLNLGYGPLRLVLFPLVTFKFGQRA